MQITVIERIETMGWNLANQQAPAEVVRHAKEVSDEGWPVAIGRYKSTGAWCVVIYNEDGQPKVAYQHPAENTAIPVNPSTPSAA